MALCGKHIQYIYITIYIYIFFFSKQIATEPSSTIRGKLADWSDSVWNRFDIMALFLAFLALCLRMQKATFKWGRITYAINTTIFYCRLFRIYHVNYHLGPKLVIFYRMVSNPWRGGRDSKTGRKVKGDEWRSR